MPYIEGSERVDVDAAIYSLLDYMEWCGCTPGILNYIITRIINQYVNTKGKNYTHINDAIGVLEATKQEYYRRVVADYEQKKMETNGDVF